MAIRTIVTDLEILHKQSEPVGDIESQETLDLLRDLYDSLPDKQLGLAAPQIDVQKRVFVAWLPALNRTYGFVNPKFDERSEARIESTEGCLSLPGQVCTIERCAYVTINADRIVELTKDDDSNVEIKTCAEPLSLSGLEAFIVQHENDHLDGVVISDLNQVVPRDQKLQDRAQKRQAKIQARRRAKKAAKQASQINVGAKKPKSKKEIEKKKKLARQRRARRRRSIEIAERYKAEQEGLFDPSA